MWAKWEERLKTFGAKRIDFATCKRGGSTSGKVVTGAKSILFFKCDDPSNEEECDKEITLEWIADKLLCTEEMEVTAFDQEDV